ncbi:UDP-N-acetylglucosamine--N-acetylmuramyl-(pentapeptide) pyrophosphoryl-undecaprenol N-acetylglucosamine transferase [Candidatus Wolfebacteria bacterium]|nr:UDP-N-acetylglucosamine--N-acetylmuramyl-(pentapeptide) pyrophosphoryl-undecaprenol N-acetylglucosamine transferase [Candidatus Wolfebacteria bacterium]
MKIALTGGGSGGHFYPLIAVAEEIRAIEDERHLVPPKLFYFAPSPYNKQALFENDIEFVRIPAGKVYRYFNIKTFTGIFVTLWGTLIALWTLFRIYPDVIFSKGSFASVPVTLAARVLRIPLIIHDSDAKPGRANLLASKQAFRIAVSFPDTTKYWPEKVHAKIAYTGTPVRKALHTLDGEGAREYLNIKDNLPVVLVVTGSLGSQYVNQVVVDALTTILPKAHVIHQTGKNLFKGVKARTGVILHEKEYKDRYHVQPYLSASALQQAASIADVIISRSGATALSEFALWGKPSILIPIPEKVSHDQRTNAYAYAKSGAAVVLEQENMSPGILASQALSIISDNNKKLVMGSAAKHFARPDAGKVIAEELVRIGLEHDSKE